jgi:hypothetical protein
MRPWRPRRRHRPSVQSAQAAVVCQLNRVLEKLSQTLAEPVSSRNTPSALRSTYIVKLENALLLYRPLGVWSALLHALFYLMVSYVMFHPFRFHRPAYT